MGYFQTPWHIILLLVIALLLFGGKRLPEVGRALGSGMREFKDAITGNTPGMGDEPAQSQSELPPAESSPAETTTAPAERETAV